jgi:hypothetical protein
MKYLIQFVLTTTFLLCLGTGAAQENNTNATNADDVNESVAYAKLKYADADKAIKGNFIVVFNTSRVTKNNLHAIVDDLKNWSDGIVIEKVHETIKMVKIIVNASESGDDEDAAKEERRVKLRPWLRSEYIEIIEEVGVSSKQCSILHNLMSTAALTTLFFRIYRTKELAC